MRPILRSRCKGPLVSPEEHSIEITIGCVRRECILLIVKFHHILFLQRLILPIFRLKQYRAGLNILEVVSLAGGDVDADYLGAGGDVEAG